MMSAKKSVDIREQVDRELRSPVSDQLWDLLVGEWAYISEFDEGPVIVAHLVLKVRQIRKAAGASRRGSGRKETVLPKATAARQAALGAIHAHQANQDRDVVRIRHLIAPLTERQVLEWVVATHYASLKLTPDASPQDEAIAITNVASSSRGWPPPMLWYLDGQQPCVISVVDPLLVKLARLAQTLSERWCFPEADATNFVLTGRIPSVWRYRGSHRVHLITGNATSRIVLELDPDMSPVEVAEVYRKLRGRVKGTRVRVRPVSERTAVLAGWVVSQSEEKTWRDRRLEWNRENPHWSSNSDTNFARDARDAVRRVTNPGWSI